MTALQWLFWWCGGEAAVRAYIGRRALIEKERK